MSNGLNPCDRLQPICLNFNVRVEEFLRTADGSSCRGTAEEGNFWSMLLGPITSAISCFHRLYCSGDPETDLTQGEQELSLRNIEMELKLGEFYASVNISFFETLHYNAH